MTLPRAHDVNDLPFHYLAMDAAGRAAFIERQIAVRFPNHGKNGSGPPRAGLHPSYLEMSPEERAAFLERQIAARHP